MSARAAKAADRPAGPGSRPPALAPRALTALVVTLLGLLLLSQYPHAFRGPFVGDDYLFLEKTRLMGLPALLLPRALAFHYYRPISRELHYWVLTRTFGPRELPFHVASMLLTLAAGALYFLLLRRLAGAGIAAVAAAAVFALAAWGVLLFWAAGAQDLWMLVFALGALLCVAYGRHRAAIPLFAAALLSKETAAVLPGIALAYLVAIDRLRPRAALARTAGLWAVAVAWAAFHPMLGGRLLHPIHEATLPGLHQPLDRIAVHTLLAVVNLDEWPKPVGGWGPVLGMGVVAVALLGATALAGLASAPRPTPAPRPTAPASRVAGFGAAWALLAWCPLAMPGLGWHAYYAMFGMLGAWCALAALLARRPALAIGVVVTLALLRAGRAETPSADWGSEWFQRRAANFGVLTRAYLFSRYPSFPPHSRIYMAELPGGMCLVPGGEESPALRVWYRDTTLQTYFASRYRPRPAGVNAGRDYLFTYDPTLGWREDSIVVLPEHPSGEQRLAYAEFMGTLGNFGAARAQYQALVALAPQRWEFAFNLGSCLVQQGDSALAARWYQRAAAMPGAPERIVRTAERMRRFLPP